MATAQTPIRDLVWRAARRVHAEDALRRTYEGAQRAREGRAARRNRLDDERVRLLAAAVLSEDSCCVDVGANEGKLLETFAAVAPRGRHIAYEPVPALAADLARRFPQVDVRQAAASDGEGETSFVVHRELASRSSLRSVGYPEDETETVTVRVETLDGALPDGYSPDLIKIDVEGAEQLVLEGARETLRTQRPVVLFEHQQSTASHYGSGPDEIFDLLAGELDMRIHDMDGSGPYTRAGFRDAYATGSRWNFFARPAEAR